MTQTSADKMTQSWQASVYAVLRDNHVRQIAYVPDSGFSELLNLCLDDSAMSSTVLTTEEEGVGLLAGAWLGGDRGVLMMQSSGVGNCVNMLTLIESCQLPFLSIVTMRGEWKEFNPWQEPMGRNTQAVLELAGVEVFRAEQAGSAAKLVQKAVQLVFEESRAVAVLIAQEVIGEKQWHQ